MTYRDRREAKADRLREWADKREVKSTVAFDRARQISDMIPFGQPILIGHHSEGRHRKDLDRIHNGFGAGVEHSRQADSMRSRADNIEAANAHAIYSDDPDAIDRLRERIADLETERETVKAENAAFRKANGPALKAMTAYQRNQALPHPSYVLQNLTGNITRQKQRLAGLVRDQASPRAMVKHGRRGCYVKCSAGCHFDFVIGLTYDEARTLADEHAAAEHSTLAR